MKGCWMPYGIISCNIDVSKLMVPRVLLYDSISESSSTGVFPAPRTLPRTEYVCHSFPIHRRICSSLGRDTSTQ